MDDQTSPVAIIDSHCHAASVDFTPQSFIRGVVGNMARMMESRGLTPKTSKLVDIYMAKMQDPLCDELVSEMDEAGITETVLLAPDFTFALKDSRLTIAEILAKHRAIMDRHPGRFHVFAGVDPRWGRDGIELFQRVIRDDGFQGLKIYPPCGYRPSDRALYPFYEICAQRGLPVLTHVGATSPALAFDTAHPMFLDEAARAFPSVPFILAHGATAYVEECATLCTYRPNVFLDVSGFPGGDARTIAALFARGIGHKMIFGTDWPLFRLRGTQRECLAPLLDPAGVLAEVEEVEQVAFFNGTLRSLLRGIPLSADWIDDREGRGLQ